MNGITLTTDRTYTMNELKEIKNKKGQILNIIELMNKDLIVENNELKNINDISESFFICFLEALTHKENYFTEKAYNTMNDIKNEFKSLKNPQITLQCIKRDKETKNSFETLYKFSNYKIHKLLPHNFLKIALLYQNSSITKEVFEKLDKMTHTISFFVKDKEKEAIYIKFENGDLLDKEVEQI